MRQAKVFYKDVLAGVISENEDEYTFQYDIAYLKEQPNPLA